MRAAAAIVLSALLLVPLSDVVRLTRRRLDMWHQLRERHHVPPDEAWDRYFGQLKVYIPARGRVGIVQVAPPGTVARAREYYFLQYTLAPRLLIPGANEEFLIASGPPSAAAKLVDVSQFIAVRQFGADFTLYRRWRP